MFHSNEIPFGSSEISKDVTLDGLLDGISLNMKIVKAEQCKSKSDLTLYLVFMEELIWVF